MFFLPGCFQAMVPPPADLIDLHKRPLAPLAFSALVFLQRRPFDVFEG